MKAMRERRFCAVLILALCLSSGVLAQPAPAVKETVDSVVTRMYATLDEEALSQLDDHAVQSFITEDERRVLAAKYWCFNVNVPVLVSVMRDKAQPVVPFWLPEAGFSKTDLTVKNEEYEYEVWQKAFEAGRVELGINGFDKHRPHYFVAVGPQQPAAKLELTGFVPEGQTVLEMRKGALTYHDWTELVLTQVPRELEGHALLTTIRGRAREAHLVGAFRRTPFPSSAQPDQVVLTWSEDPRTTQTIQWRTVPEVADGIVRYKEKSADPAGAWGEAKAACTVLEDRLLANDRYIHRFEAVVRGLNPATTYVYSVGSPARDTWCETAEFTTAPDGPSPFTFAVMSDTHRSPDWGALLDKAFDRHPETAFYLIAGDVVSTGLYRDDWDHLFQYARNVFDRRPVAPSIGNHDDQDGLGAWMYLALFGLPQNGPASLESERAYSFKYGNALFLVLDACSPVEDQTEWLDAQLAGTDATWKFAIFHFPPYAPSDDYPDIRTQWGAAFDKYHVDMVFSGHVHHYVRTKPMKDGKPVASPADGTIYVVTVSVPADEYRFGRFEHVDKAFGGAALYEMISIDGNRLILRTHDIDGTVRDELTIEK